ncbi:MAG TPA: SDR family oxidoreductase [Vicinamibacterales bacterium]|jgi:NAD(P)-dependent dehydrogenase (short-subunit alcohol dehydrogenase family)
MELSGKAALITGGKRIGAAIAAALAEAGMDVALSYNASRAEAEAAAAGIAAAGRRPHLAQANLSNPEDCRSLVEGAAAAFGRLDVLVNMASVYSSVPFDDTDDRVWNRVVDVDLRAAFLCSRAAVPHMRRQGGGRIVNFSDWVAASGRPRYPGFLPYYVAKSGVIALTEALALEVAADGILVNAIAPGPIMAPPGTLDEELQAVEAATPLGRWGGVEPIVRATRFLIDTDFVTGETIRVDGGRHVK